MRRFIIGIMIAALIVTAAPLAFAQCPLTAEKAGSADAGDTVVNSVCPVMGGEVTQDTPYKLTYKGKTVGFCCSGCVNAFKANPKKYQNKLNEIIGQQEES